MKMLHIVSKSDGLYEVILVLCDRSLHRKVKGKFYGPIISPTNVMKDNHVLQKVQVAHPLTVYPFAGYFTLLINLSCFISLLKVTLLFLQDFLHITGVLLNRESCSMILTKKKLLLN